MRASAGVSARGLGRHRARGWASAAVVLVSGRRGQVDEEEAGHQWAPPAMQRRGRLPARQAGTWE
jgi:hypothetical protein